MFDRLFVSRLIMLLVILLEMDLDNQCFALALVAFSMKPRPRSHGPFTNYLRPVTNGVSKDLIATSCSISA